MGKIFWQSLIITALQQPDIFTLEDEREVTQYLQGVHNFLQFALNKRNNAVF